MKSFEENNHAFVVRVWLEPRELEGAAPQWRGVIEHVPSGERRYISDLSCVIRFMATYLYEKEDRRNRHHRLGNFLGQLRSQLRRALLKKL